MIKIEPVGKPVLQVLFPILEIISPKDKSGPTQKTVDGSVQTCASSLRRGMLHRSLLNNPFLFRMMFF